MCEFLSKVTSRLNYAIQESFWNVLYGIVSCLGFYKETNKCFQWPTLGCEFKEQVIEPLFLVVDTLCREVFQKNFFFEALSYFYVCFYPCLVLLWSGVFPVHMPFSRRHLLYGFSLKVDLSFMLCIQSLHYLRCGTCSVATCAMVNSATEPAKRFNVLAQIILQNRGCSTWQWGYDIDTEVKEAGIFHTWACITSHTLVLAFMTKKSELLMGD